MAVKPIGPRQPTVRRATLGSVRLWRDDIEKLVQLIETGFPGPAITIQGGGYEFDTVNDIGAIESPTLSNLKITTNDDRLYLGIEGGDGCVVQIKDPDMLSEGFQSHLEGFIRQHRLRLSAFSRSDTLKLSSLLICLGLLNWSRNHQLGSVFNIALMVATIVSLVLLIEWPAATKRKYRVLIYTKKRAEAPPFLERKRDDLWIEAVVGVVSLVLGGVIGYWINTIT